MKSNFEKVREFHEKIAQTIPAKNGKVNFDDFKLYVSLITEEYIELMEAAGDYDFVNGRPSDMVAVIDGAIDLLYVTYGLLNVLNVDADELFDIIHKSNMTKRVRNRDHKGKVLKHESFNPPTEQIKQYLEEKWYAKR